MSVPAPRWMLLLLLLLPVAPGPGSSQEGVEDPAGQERARGAPSIQEVAGDLAPAPPVELLWTGRRDGSLPSTGGGQQWLAEAVAETAPISPDGPSIVVEPAGQTPRWDGARRTLRRSTLTALWLTATLGSVVALNQPTLLGDGRCETERDPILGDYGCGELSTVHGMSAMVAAVSYTTSQVLEVFAGVEPDRLGWTWVHRSGMALLPLAGILSRFPEVVGIRNEGTQESFSEVLRTIHAGVGYTTVIAYTITF